jgi:hypothetical protein
MLSHGSVWTPVATNTAPSSSPISILQSIYPLEPARFYRMREQ